MLHVGVWSMYDWEWDGCFLFHSGWFKNRTSSISKWTTSAIRNKRIYNYNSSRWMISILSLYFFSISKDFRNITFSKCSMKKSNSMMTKPEVSSTKMETVNLLSIFLSILFSYMYVVYRCSKSSYLFSR